MQASYLSPALPDTSLGIPPALARPALTQEAFKELVNKLAWSIGSTYGKPYSSTRCVARIEAIALARSIIAEHGYPENIKK